MLLNSLDDVLGGHGKELRVGGERADSNQAGQLLMDPLIFQTKPTARRQ